MEKNLVFGHSYDFDFGIIAKVASFQSTACAEFLGRLDRPITGEELFDRLPDLVYFVKNERAEYVIVNQTLCERCGRRRKEDLLGLRADEVFPSPLGDSYRSQDLGVLAHGTTILDQLELHLYPTGQRGWCLTTKLPLHDRQHRVIGLVGISKDLQAPDEGGEDFAAVAVALRYLTSNFAEPIRFAVPAAVAKSRPISLSAASGAFSG